MPADNGRRPVALVTTTVNVPTCLDGYLRNLEQHGHGANVSVIVVGDRNTPADAPGFCQELDKRYAATVTYLDVPAQEKFLRRWPTLDVVLRYNCIQRRNVGYLQARVDGAEVIVALDDDNIVTDEDYLGPHLLVGTTIDVPVVSHRSGWWNVCERLDTQPPRQFYHRGYPQSRRTFERGGHAVEKTPVRVAVNAGLWLKNPDVDATTNLEEPVNVVGMTEVAGSRAAALAAGTWCPFNSQNTSFHISTLPAMYLVVMLDRFRGYRIGRLDDIWMSYFLRAIGDQLGESVVYGPPLVTQDRNPHDLVTDLSEELGGYLVTEKLVAYLREFKLTATSYLGGYEELIYHLRRSSERDQGSDLIEKEYFRNMLIGMAAWHGAVADLEGVKR